MFINALTLIFVCAKLFGVIDWSWWLVFSPTIAAIVLVFSFTALGVFLHGRRK